MLTAASLLVAQDDQLPKVAFIMLLFGIGAAVPLLAIGMMSQSALLAIRGRLASGGSWGRRVIGLGLALVGFFVLPGLDHRAEAVILDASPEVVTQWTVRY